MLHVLCAGSMSELVQQLLEKGVDYTILNKVTDITDEMLSFVSHDIAVKQFDAFF